jgi:hypothetical protein
MSRDDGLERIEEISGWQNINLPEFDFIETNKIDEITNFETMAY